MSDTRSITPFLMFQNGSAEEAMNFYVDLFDGATVLVDRYGEETPEMEGKIRLATFAIANQQVNIIDSSVQHQFDFTPSMSLFIRVGSAEEFDHLWEGLASEGHALMPKDDYGFGTFGWINDRYGVSWQLNVEAAASAI